MSASARPSTISRRSPPATSPAPLPAFRRPQRKPPMSERPPLNPIVKLALDLGPLVLFFVANSRYGIFAATAVFMVAVLAALLVSYVMTRRLPIMPVATAIIVVVFGGLTLILHDPTVIKGKPTILYRILGAVFIGRLRLNKAFLGV